MERQIKEGAVGQYVQYIKKDHAFDFLKVKGDNFAKIDTIIELKKYKRLVFPNYLLKKLIGNAKKTNISISSIGFYGELSQDIEENINEFIERKNYDNLLKLIEETRLNIKYVEFFDLKEKKYSRLFSNGIAWIEESHVMDTVLKNLLSV